MLEMKVKKKEIDDKRNKSASNIIRKFQSGKFYLNINDIQSSKNPSQIELSTKILVTDTNNYSKYLNSYSKLTMQHSFKIPQRCIYPVFTNPALIPLQKNGYTFYNIKKENKKPKLLLRDINNMNGRKQSCYTFLTNTTERSNQGSNSINKNNERLLSMPNENCKTKEMRRKNPLGWEHEQLFLLCNTFFNEQNDNCSNLKYDEREIFFKEKEYYDNFIEKKIEYLKLNKNENFTSILSKKYDKEGKNELILTLTSITVDFINLSSLNEKQSLTLPFNYFPIFLYKNLGYFLYFFLSLIEFDDDSYRKLHISDEKFSKFLKVSSLFKNKTEKKINLMSSKPQLESTNPLVRFSDIFPNKRPYDANVFSFLWYTPKITYKVEMHFPQIKLQMLKFKKTIYHYVQWELILFLLERNFSNWNFYIVRYLFSYKKFRLIIEQCLSKNKHLLILNNLIQSEQVNDFEIYSLSKTKNISLIDDESYYEKFVYFTTAFDENTINILHSFSIKVTENEKENIFNLSFQQMKILSSVGRNMSFSAFIERNFTFNQHKNSSICLNEQKNFPFANKEQIARPHRMNMKKKSYKFSSTQIMHILSHRNSKEKIKKAKVEINYPSLEKISFKEGILEREMCENERREVTSEGIRKLLELKSKVEWVVNLFENEEEITVYKAIDSEMPAIQSPTKGGKFMKNTMTPMASSSMFSLQTSKKHMLLRFNSNHFIIPPNPNEKLNRNNQEIKFNNQRSSFVKN